MTVMEMVKGYLKANNLDGLINDDDGCLCILEDFAPCGPGPYKDCEAAKVAIIPESGVVEVDGKIIAKYGTPGDCLIYPATD